MMGADISLIDKILNSSGGVWFLLILLIMNLYFFWRIDKKLTIMGVNYKTLKTHGCNKAPTCDTVNNILNTKNSSGCDNAKCL